MTRDNGTKRVVRVLCLHHLGGNSHQMRRTLQPYFDELAAACPDLCFEPWYVDGPFLLPTALNGGLARGGLSRSTSTGQGATRHTAGEAAEAALTYVSLKRAVDAEEYSERLRPYKYKRTTGDVSEQALARLDAAIEKNRSGGLLQRASEILDSKASADQVRWWQMPCDAYDNPGPWVGHEYSIAHLGRFISEHGPFDGMIGHSGGGLIGQYCHALLAGALDASQEALFPFPMPPAEPASYAFRFSVMFAPVLPDTPRVAYLARVSATPLRSLVLTGKRDSYQTPCEIVCDYVVSLAWLTTNLAFLPSSARPPAKVTCRAFAQLVGAQDFWEHEGGHGIPRDAHSVKRVTAWLAREARALDRPAATPRL